MILAGARYFSDLKNVHMSNGIHPASYSMNIRGSLPRGKVARAWSWNTHAHVVLRSRMTGDIPLLYLYGFMARTGTTSSLPSIVPAGPANKNSLSYTAAVLCIHITLWCFSRSCIHNVQYIHLQWPSFITMYRGDNMAQRLRIKMCI